MHTHLHTIAQKLLPTWIYERVIGRWNVDGLKRYTSNTFWALLARTINTLVSFLVTIYLVRYLGPENYGNLSYAISFIGLFGIIATLGIDNVLYRDLVKYPAQRNTYLGTAFVIRLLSGVVAALTAGIVGFLANQDDVSKLVILVLAGTFIFNAFSIITNEFQANVAQKYPSFVTIVVVFILNALKLGVIFLGEGVLYFALILLLEPILYAILFSYIRVRHYGSFKTWRFDGSIAKKLIHDSWPFIFTAVFMALYSRIDQIMLKHLVDSAAVGIYDAALRIAESWLFIPAIITSSLFPAIVNAKMHSVREYRTRLLTLTIIFAIGAACIALPLSMFAEPIMLLLYGDAFAGSAIVFAVYVWVGVWAVISIVTHHFLIVENLRKSIFFFTVGTALLNTALNIVLIPAYGPAGAAWSTFISYSLLAVPLVLIYRLK